MSVRGRREFDASISLLPDSLAERAVAMTGYALGRPLCGTCREVQELVWLAFDASYVGDHVAAAHSLDQAESRISTPHDQKCRKARAAENSSGRVSLPIGKEPLFAASDASHDRTGGGLGFVTSAGHWGMRRWLKRTNRHLPDPSGKSKVLVAELRAALMAINALGEHARRATLLLDSKPAIHYLRAWQAGKVEEMPEGYSLRPRTSGAQPRLVQLATRIAALPELSIQHVKGHSGHPLNEAADALARLANRNPPDKQARAEGLVKAFVRAWHSDETARRFHTGGSRRV